MSAPTQSAPFNTRFADRIVTNPATGCHDWTGKKDRDGYGILRENGRDVRAHRAAWEAAHGRRVPRGLVVSHRCDRPSCVNSDHLEAKSQPANIADRQRRDRQAKGSRNGRSKMTEEQVAAAKRVLADGRVPDARVARMLGVSKSVVRDIKAGKTWDHVEAER